MCKNESCCYHKERSGCIHDNKYKLPVVEITETGDIVFTCPICGKEHLCEDKRTTDERIVH